MDLSINQSGSCNPVNITDDKSLGDDSNLIPLQGLGVYSPNMFYGAQPILFRFAKELRSHQTEAESFLWDNLSRITIKNIRFKRQHPVLYFIADFLLP